MVLGSNTSGHVFDTTFTTNGPLYSAASGVVTSGAAGSSGQVYQSAGAGSAPAYTTATFPSTATGTGKVLVADGTNWVASTPTFPNASATSGKIIQSDGTNWLASTPTYPTTAGTSGKIHISDGTNIVSSTPTYPNAASTALKHIKSDGTNFVTTTVTYPDASVTAGKVIISDGTNYIASTPTFPNVATGTGTILRADGTNWVATTSTYPNTNAVSTLLYASSANVMAALATANSGVLTTDSSGVPSIDTTNFVRQTNGMQMKGNNTNTAPPAGFIGEQLTANASAVSLSNATAKTVTSVTLTAGVWDISGMCFISNTGVWSLAQAGISTTNNTMPAGSAGINFASAIPSNTSANGQTTFTLPPLRALLSGSTIYYMVATNSFSTGSSSSNAYITATRVG